MHDRFLNLVPNANRTEAITRTESMSLDWLYESSKIYSDLWASAVHPDLQHSQVQYAELHRQPLFIWQAVEDSTLYPFEYPPAMN